MTICSFAQSHIDWLCLITQKVRELVSSDQNKKCVAVYCTIYHHEENGVRHTHMFVQSFKFLHIIRLDII
jgi:hypothetical protein